MFRYEILILTIPEITKDEASTLEFQVDKLIKSIKGNMISFERWGKYRLSYPVRKNDYGVYFLVRFEVEEKHSISKELNVLFSVKFSDIVMRSFVTALDPDKSLEYQKPPSLEDTPRRHISTFLEEKGLLKSKRTKSEAEREKPLEQEEAVADAEELVVEQDQKEENPVEPEVSLDKKEEVKVEEPAVEAQPISEPEETLAKEEVAEPANDVAETTKEV